METINSKLYLENCYIKQQIEKLRWQAEMLNQENIALCIEFKQKFAVVVAAAADRSFVTDCVQSTSSSNSKASRSNKKARNSRCYFAWDPLHCTSFVYHLK
ncbi:hypothetical protein RD792_017238 [Penstemon davidsonii]|uniref:Uncharacterized protein n=1 Tax=Penstemon davidsonii TaxID=160366 RepID=A0ABR0CN37_9LAMI|nr:hypothetical protein RD792_017238 [Penstemon davidsonii]